MLLWLDSRRPPIGRLEPAAAAPVPFTGWLELLARLSELFDEASDTPEQEIR